MAKINPIKTRQEAEKAEKAGKLDQAIPLYRQLLEDNPRDWNTINKIGDLFAKIGKMREAGDEYAKVAEFYARDGFHLKAIAIWKKINKLDPSVVEPYARLADLYAKQGLVMEAKGQYQIVSEDQLKRGRLKEAAETLRKMVEIDSADLKTRSRLADIYTKEGSTDKAVSEYIAISDELNLKGHPAEAIQVLEKGLKIDNGTSVRAHLGKLHLAQRSYDKAIAYLEEVTAQDSSPDSLMQLGQAYLGAKRVADAQSTLESVLSKSPESQEARVILVQIYAVQGRADEAFDGVLPLVEQLLLKRDADRASNLLLQITSRSPHHVRTLQKLVEVARVRQDDRAVVKALNALLEAHIAAGSDRAAEDTAEQLVQVEPENEQFKARLESLRKKKAAPVLGGPAKVATKRVEAEVALPPPAASAGTSDLDGLEFDTGAIVRPKGISATSNTDREFIEEHLAESRVFRKYGLLDKAEEQVDLVLVRYPNIFDGRFEKKEILKETERFEAAARECLWLSAVAAKDGNDSLATMLADEARVLWPGISEADEPLAEAPPDEGPLAEAPPMGEEYAEAGSAADAFEAPTPELSFESMGESPALGLEGLGELAPDESVQISAAPPVDEEEDLNLDVDVEDGQAPDFGALPDAPAEMPDAGFGLGFGEEAPPAPAEELSFAAQAAADEDAEARAAGFGDPETEAPGSDELPAPDELPDHGPDLDLTMEPARAAAPPAPAVDPEIARSVEEVDSYIALGFVDDAKDVLRDALNRFPGDPLLAERAASLGLDLKALAEAPAPAPAAPPAKAASAPAPAPAPEPSPFDEPAPSAAAAENDLLGGLSFDDLPAPPEPAETAAAVNMRVAEAPAEGAGSIDLGAELSALFDAQPALEEVPEDTSRSSSFEDQGLQDVFNEFKKGVDSQLGEGDYDTRYNLGIAYKEMGLVDEAIAEFQLAAKDPKRSLECSSMIGICFMEKGMAEVAVQWYERGLQVPGRAPEEYRGLRYDLGLAWEASGELAKAKATFEGLVREDPSFRDVSDKLRDLQSRV
ncbi:MAG: tetratricopeptide repeat protein [Vicinamibacteria bacterium]|nr:tetratricopeptide repeat protein [Vicinamibacteria bacterium]